MNQTQETTNMSNDNKDMSTVRFINKKRYESIEGRSSFPVKYSITPQLTVRRTPELMTISWGTAVKLFTNELKTLLAEPPYDKTELEIDNIMKNAASNYDETIDLLLKDTLDIGSVDNRLTVDKPTTPTVENE